MRERFGGGGASAAEDGGGARDDAAGCTDAELADGGAALTGAYMSRTDGHTALAKDIFGESGWVTKSAVFPFNKIQFENFQILREEAV